MIMMFLQKRKESKWIWLDSHDNW